MKKVWMLFFLAAVFFTGKPIESQVSTTQFSIKVVVDDTDVDLSDTYMDLNDMDVDLNDTDDDSQEKPLKESIRASLKASLGRLADVEVVEESPSFVLRVIVMGPIRTDEPLLGPVPTLDAMAGMRNQRGLDPRDMRKELIVASYVLTKSNAGSHEFVKHSAFAWRRVRSPGVAFSIAMGVDSALEKFR